MMMGLRGFEGVCEWGVSVGCRGLEVERDYQEIKRMNGVKA